MCVSNIASATVLATLVAIDLKSCQRSFPSFCTPPCEVAVLFYRNLNSTLAKKLLCTRFDELKMP